VTGHAVDHCSRFTKLSSCLATGYPTIKSNTGKTFQGDRSIKGLMDWATAQIQSKVQAIKSKAQLDAFLASCKGGAKGGRTAKTAGVSTGLGLVLLTEKSDSSSLLRSLSQVN
jgi:ABC-type sulfate transport system substrate-binding protein